MGGKVAVPPGRGSRRRSRPCVNGAVRRGRSVGATPCSDRRVGLVGGRASGTMTGVNPSGQRSDGETAPFHGEVVTLRFDGREVAVWWGPDGDLDRLAAAEGGFSLAVGGRLRGATCGGRGCTDLGA